MKAILIYNEGEEYEYSCKIDEFDSKEEMIKFINDNNVGEYIIAAYEFYKKIEIEPYEKTIKYKIKNK